MSSEAQQRKYSKEYYSTRKILSILTELDIDEANSFLWYESIPQFIGRVNSKIDEKTPS